MLSLFEMYHDTITNRKKYNFLCRRLIKKSNRQIKHANILFVKFKHTFFITCKSIICVSNDTNYRVFSIVHIIIILLAQ